MGQGGVGKDIFVGGRHYAQEDLTNDDRAALTRARERARAALSPPELDARAGELLLNRLAHREAVAADAVESLNGNARRYSQAFAAVDGSWSTLQRS